MSDKPKVKKGDQVCFWLAYGQPYLATVVEVFEQENAAGGPTVDLAYPDQMVLHVAYDPNGQPRSYCLSDDPGWPGTLSKIRAAEAEEEAPKAQAEVEEEAPKAQTVAGTAKRAQPK